MPPIYAKAEQGKATLIAEDGQPALHIPVDGSKITVSVSGHLVGEEGSAQIIATYGMALHGDHKTLRAGEEQTFKVEGEEVVIGHKER